MTVPPPGHVAPSIAPPARTDVVVIGGGIVGASTALFLARKGLTVTLCEKGRIAGEQSGRNWGWCRKMGRDHREIPLILRSLDLWREMNGLVESDTGFTTCGILYAFATEREAASYAPYLEHARQHQIDSRLVTGDEIARIMPGLSQRFAGGMWTPSDGRAEPQKAAPAIARAVARLGGTVLTNCAVRDLERKAGRVSGVVTERGRIGCDAVVLAGGAWSRLFCGNQDLMLPQLKVLGSVLRTEPLPGGPEASVAGLDFAFRRRQDGGYTIANGDRSIADITPDSFRLLGRFIPAWRQERRHLGLRVGERFVTEWRTPRRWAADSVTPFERTRVLDPAPSDRLLDAALVSLRRAFPAFGQVRVADRWGGLIDVTPDAVPVISPAPAIPGFFIATGFSGHGFGIGPGAGRLMADIVAGDAPIVDPAPFRLSRFSDGSRIAPEAGV